MLSAEIIPFKLDQDNTCVRIVLASFVSLVFLSHHTASAIWHRYDFFRYHTMHLAEAAEGALLTTSLTVI